MTSTVNKIYDITIFPLMEGGKPHRYILAIVIYHEEPDKVLVQKAVSIIYFTQYNYNIAVSV